MTTPKPALPELLHDAIKDVLMRHRLSYTEGEDGEAFPLVDRLCPPGSRDISKGSDEITLICDAIYNDDVTRAAITAAVAEARAVPARTPDERAADKEHMRSMSMPTPPARVALSDGAALKALADLVARTDRARDILTDGKPTPQCNWGLLDTSTARAVIAEYERVNGVTPAQGEQP